MEATEPEGLPRFKCPEDFSAVPFAPGPPFSPETLQDPTKQLVLIRAPANFSPESLNGHFVPLSGFETLTVPQLDKAHKAYSLQATPGELVSCARLLIPSDHQDQLTCAPSFAVSLNVRERFGDPSAHQILFPVASRMAPQIPDGLRQRFLPFGGQPKRPLPPSSGDAQIPPRKKKKRRQLHMVSYMGDPGMQSCLEGREHELPFGESTTPFQGPWEGGRSSQHTEGLGLFGAMKQQPEEEIQPNNPLGGSSQEAHVSGEAEELSHKIKKKKKKHKEDVLENRECMDPGSISQQSQVEPQPAENGDSEKVLAQHKHKKKKKRHQEENAEALLGLASAKEESVQEPCEGSGMGTRVEGSLEFMEEGDPGGERSGHKSRKKKKKEKAEEEKPLVQEMGPVLLEPHSVKQELDRGELDVTSGQAEGWTDSQGLSMEGSSQKHKKKKKKRKEEERGSLKEGGLAEQEQKVMPSS